MPDRPNFLVIMTDQQRGDCLSCAGHPVLLTPQMDDIGARGVRFTRAYSTSPVCVPARRSLLSGQFPATHGIFGNGKSEWEGPTLPGELARAGYHTALVGRSMHQDPPRKRYGYDEMVISEHRLPLDDYHAFLEQHQTDGSGGYYGTGVLHNDWTSRPWHLPEALHHTNWTVNEALKFLERRDPSCPFFLTVSFVAPHPPLVPPAPYFERYIRTGVPDPAIGDWATPPETEGLSFGACPHRNVRLEGEALLSTRAGYYGLINHIDDQIHRLFSEVSGVDKLTKNNTVVVYCCDHGEMLGDHYMWRKSMPYESAAHIPFMIRAPERFELEKGTTNDQPVGLEDIMPTVLEMAGVDVPESVDGQSLLPLMRGESTEWRRHIQIECAPTFQCLTDGKEKYIWFVADGREQFFDLREDPTECHDLIAVPERAERVAWWRGELVEALKDRPEGFSDGNQLIPGRTYRNVRK